MTTINKTKGDAVMQKIKYIAVLSANYIIIPCAFVFYIGGVFLWQLFIVFQTASFFFNYLTAKSKLSLTFLNANLLISTVIANYLMAYLYDTRIHPSNNESILVYNFIQITFTIIILTVSVVLICIKKKKDK